VDPSGVEDEAIKDGRMKGGHIHQQYWKDLLTIYIQLSPSTLFHLLNEERLISLSL
jgi:hypothetical protein